MNVSIKNLNGSIIFVLIALSLFLSSCSFTTSDPYSPESVSRLIAQYNSSRSEASLIEYAQQMEYRSKHHEKGEPVRAALPVEIETYLISILQNGTPADKKNIIRFYAKAMNITSADWKIATYKDKAIIGDVLQIAPQLCDEDKLGALKLVENLRRDKSLYKPELRGDKNSDSKIINAVLKIYKDWWNLPYNLRRKLEVDPLASSIYRWVELE